MFQAWLVKIAKIAAQFRAKLAARKQVHEEDHGKGEKAQHRHRLQDIERGNDDALGLFALGGERRDDKGEQQREAQRREHPERGQERVMRQVPGVERYRLEFEARERLMHRFRRMRHPNKKRANGEEDDGIVAVGPGAGDGGGDGGDAAVAGGACCHGHRFLAPGVWACQPAVIPCASGGLVNALGVLEVVPRVRKTELQPVFIGE